MSDAKLLKRRLSSVEQVVEGEKLVTRHILEQTRRNGDDIAAMRIQLARIEGRCDRTDAELRGLRSEVKAFRAEFPKIVAETVREVFGNRDR